MGGGCETKHDLEFWTQDDAVEFLKVEVSFGFNSGSQWGFQGWESFKGLRLKLSGQCHE